MTVKPLVIFLLVFFSFLGICFLGVNLDLYFNPWIKESRMQWWNIFTTEHFGTWLYCSNFFLWLLWTLVFCAGASAIVTVVCQNNS